MYLRRAMAVVDLAMPDCLDRELLGLYTLLAATKGHDTTDADTHTAWAVRQMRIDPTHPSLVPFNELPQHIQRKDTPFTLAIREATNRVVEITAGGDLR